MEYEHPIYTPRSVAAQRRLPEAEGSTAVVVFSKASGTLSPADLTAIEGRVSQLLFAREAEEFRVARVRSGPAPFDEGDAELIELGINHEQQHQELLLTDIVMPEMDGIELARRAAEPDRDRVSDPETLLLGELRIQDRVPVDASVQSEGEAIGSMQRDTAFDTFRFPDCRVSQRIDPLPPLTPAM
mgnify:CR=1 FL=1